jgi:hypothetical protein
VTRICDNTGSWGASQKCAERKDFEDPVKDEGDITPVKDDDEEDNSDDITAPEDEALDGEVLEYRGSGNDECPAGWRDNKEPVWVATKLVKAPGLGQHTKTVLTVRGEHDLRNRDLWKCAIVDLWSHDPGGGMSAYVKTRFFEVQEKDRSTNPKATWNQHCFNQKGLNHGTAIGTMTKHDVCKAYFAAQKAWAKEPYKKMSWNPLKWFSKGRAAGHNCRTFLGYFVTVLEALAGKRELWQYETRKKLDFHLYGLPSDEDLENKRVALAHPILYN